MALGRWRSTTTTTASPRARGLSSEEAERRLAARGPVEPPATSRSYVEHRPGQRLHGLQPDPGGLRVRSRSPSATGGTRSSSASSSATPRSGSHRRSGRSGRSTAWRRSSRRRRPSCATARPRALARRGGGRRRPRRASRRATSSSPTAGSTRRAGCALDESCSPASPIPWRGRPATGCGRAPSRSREPGAYEVTAVGPESYAERIAGQARAFRHPRSPLERALNRLLIIARRRDGAARAPARVRALAARRGAWTRRSRRSVAAVVSLVPEGLILLTSLTYAVAALRMARRGALAQQLNAIESLAAVDVVCLDKTGTLTEGSLRVVELVPEPGVDEDELAAALGRYAASSPSRATRRSRRSPTPMRGPGGGGRGATFPSPRAGGWSAVELATTPSRPRSARAFRARRSGGAGGGAGARAAAAFSPSGRRRPCRAARTRSSRPPASGPLGLVVARRAAAPGRARDGRVLPRPRASS